MGLENQQLDVSAQRRRRRRHPVVRALVVLSLLLPSIATVIVRSDPAAAALPPIAMTFFVPLPEAQVIDTFETLTGNNADPIINNVVSIISTQDSAVISYDHWEDGFESDARDPVQATTEVWGDGTASNGCAGSRKTPPTLPCNDADDVILEGDVFIVQNNIPAQPRNAANLFFDGGDRIDASAFIVVSQATQPATISGNPGSLIGGAVQVYDTIRYGTNFVVPIGEDLTAAKYNRLGEYTTLFVMAAEDNTTVQLDTDADGVTDFTRTLNAGESIHVDGDLATQTLAYPNRNDYNISSQIDAGATVASSAPVQAYMAAASLESSYQARFLELVPTANWDVEYFAPIATVPNLSGVGTADASLFLFNPGTNPITVTLTFSDFSTTNVTVPPGGNEISTLPLAQTNSGVRLTSPDTFFAVALVDTNDATSTGDWGLTLLPATGQTRTLKAGWAPGSADTSTENSNPIWIMAADDALIYIDYDGDGIGPFTAPNGEAYDIQVNLAALELYKIFEPDNDQTGTRVFTLDNTPITGAWGQDGSVASTASPGLDMGTTVFPGPAVSVSKVASIVVDVNGNGLLDPGDTVRYTATIRNASTVAATDIVVIDTPDTYANYVPNSTTGGGVAIPDETSPDTPFPLDAAGFFGPVVQPGTSYQYQYDMVVDLDIDPNQTEFINTIRMTTSAGNGIASTLLPIKYPSLAIRKFHDDADGIVDPGQVVTFTVEVTNTDLLTQNDFNVSDIVPAGLTYVPESTLAVGTDSNLVSHSVRDEFSVEDYGNNDGADLWTADWDEINEGDNPGGGRIQIILPEGQLEFDDLDSRQIQRAANLSDPSITVATLTLDYDVTDINNEGIVVQLWNGGSWDTINTLDEFLPSPTGTLTHILTAAQTSANTQIRFIGADTSWSGGEIGLIDNVQFAWDTGSTASVVLDNIPGGATPDLVNGDPTVANLIVPADGFALAEDDKVTITYQAIVDIDAWGDLTNTATATTLESPDPISDDSTVSVLQPMTLDVVKTDVLNGTGIAGDTIDYTITITNTSNVPVSNISVTDSLADADASLACTPVEPFSLAAAASATCTATHTITQAEVDAGEVLNTASATGEDPAGDPVTEDSDDPDDPTDDDPDGDGDPDDPTATPLTQTGELSVLKTDVLNGTGSAGDTIDYTITVTNTGTVTVDNIDVTDSLADADASVTCTPVEAFTLAPAGSATCTATHTITQTEVDAGSIDNTATAAGEDPDGNPVTDDSDDPDDLTDDDPDGDGDPDDPTVTSLAQVPGLAVTKVDSLNGTGIVGDTIDYTITVTNTGNVTVSDIDMTDNLADAEASLVCTPAELFTLAPAASATCLASHTITQTDVDAGSVLNTATATGEDPDGNPVTDTSDDPDDPTDDDPDGDGDPDDPTTTSLAQTPGLSVTKTDSLNGTGVAGDTIDYTITVTNTGNVTVSDIDMTDNLADAEASLVCTPAELFTLAPAASATCLASHTITQTDVDAGSVLNTATATGEDPDGNPVTDDSDDPDDPTDDDPDGDGEPDDPTTTSLAQTPGLSVTKTDSLNGTGVAGDTIDYTITVTNTGNLSLSAISLTDSLADADASLDCSPTIMPAGLAPGQSFTCTATHTITQTEVDAGEVLNTATATGQDPTNAPITDDSDDPDDPTDTDPDGDGEPDDPTVTSLAQVPGLAVTKVDSLNGTGAAGDTIDYTITVTNTGNLSLSAISVTDSLADADASVTCTPVEPFSLAPGASATCTAIHTVTQPEVDAGRATNTATAAGEDPDGNPVTDDSDDPDDLTDDDPDGDGDPDDPTVTSLAQVPGLAVTKVDSLNGTGIVGDTIDYTITVTNTGNVTVSDIDMTDNLADAEASLVCTPAELFTLAPAASATCLASHTITQTDVDAGSVLNTATATGEDPDGNPVTDTSDDPDDLTDDDPDGDGDPDDPTTTSLAQTPGLSVTKTDSLNGTGVAGDTIDYTITVTNTGNVTVSDIDMTDNLADAEASLVCTPAELFTLAPAASATCLASHTITQTDVDAGSVLNTATATGEDPGGNPVTDDSDDPDDPTDDDPDGDGDPDDPTTTSLSQVPRLSALKVDVLAGTGIAGDTIDYTITVTNAGTVTINNITVSDSLPDADTSLVCAPVEPFVLAPGASAVCTATHTVTQAEVDAGQVVNTATATGTDTSGNPVADVSDDPDDPTDVDPDGDGEPDDPTITPLSPNAALQVTKTDTLNGTGAVGDTIDYFITVSNVGTATVSGISVADSLTDADTSLGCAPVEPFDLAPGFAAICTATHTVTQPEVDAGRATNTATAAGEDPDGNPVTDDSDDPDDLTDDDPDGDGDPDDPTVTSLAQAPGLSVLKTDVLNGTGIAGDTIDYTITVTNTGDVTVDTIDVADNLADADTSIACTPLEAFTLAPGDSATCTASHTVTQAEVDAGRVDNTATATGTDPGGNPVTDDSDDPDDLTDDDPDGDGEPDDPTTTSLAQAPGLSVVKTDSLNGTGTAGDTIDYSIIVTNSGTVTISNLTLTDSLADADASLDCSPTVLPTSLSPGTAFSCTATHTVTQPEADAGFVINTATANGENPAAQPVSDDSDDPDDLADVDPDGDGEPDDPTITPLTQTPELSVLKSDSLNGTGIAGDTIDYNLTITNTGSTTIDNILVADALADANASLDCTPTILPATLAPTGSFTCTATHTVTQTEVDAGRVINTAAVSGTDPGAQPVTDTSDDPDDPTDIDPDGDGEPDDPTITPLTQASGLDVTKTDTLNGSGVAGDTIDYTIIVRNAGTVTATVNTVTDSLPDADASLACGALPTALAPNASFNCTATHTITQAEVDSGSVINTATASGVDTGGNALVDDSDDPDDPTDIDPNADGSPDDPTITPLSQVQTLSVLKTDSLNGTGIAGDTIDYTITVANSGTTTVTVDSLIDSLADADASLNCGPTILPVSLTPAQSFVCTATHTITQAEVDSGSVINTVTASGTDVGGSPISDDSDDPDNPTDVDPNGDGNPDDPTVTPLSAADELRVIKNDSLGGTGIAGDVISYTISVLNSGTTTIDNIVVSDSLPGVDGTLDCSPTVVPASLAPGASFTCTANHVVTQADVDSGSVTNVATASGTNPSGDPVSDPSDDPNDPTDIDPDTDGEPDDPTVTVLSQLPELTVTKVDTLGGTGVAGDLITYTIITANSGTTTATVDNLVDSLADADASLNCGATVLPIVMLPGESFTCTASHTVTQAEVDAGQVANVATASGTDHAALPLTDESDDPDDPTDVDPNGDGNPDDPTVTPLSRIAELRVNKTDSLNGSGVAGDTIDYTITTVNNGTVTIDGIVIADSLPDAAASLDCSPTVLPTTLTPGQAFTCTATHTITQGEVDTGFVTNEAVAAGTDPLGDPVSDVSDDPSDTTNVDPDGDGEPDDPTVTPLAQAPGLSVTKTDILAGAGIAGDTITYSITTTNSGTVTISGISLTDSLADADASLDCSPAALPATLAPGGAFTCTATHTVTQADVDAGDVSNVATAAGLNPSGNPVDDTSDDPDDTTNVDPNGDGEPDDPTITPLSQVPELSVLKSDSLNGSGVAGDTIDYTITVINTGTVTAAAIDVSDTLGDADASLTCVPPEAFTLVPGAAATCSATHTITQAEVDAGSVTNTASAAGTDPDGNPIVDESDDPDDPTNVDPDGDGEPDDPTITPLTQAPGLSVTKTDVIAGAGNAGDSVNYSITVTNSGTVSVSAIDVTDSLGDADASLVCIPAEAFTLAPGASATCTASHTITQGDVDAGQIINVATATGTDPSANPIADDSDDPDNPTDIDPNGDGNPDDPTVTPLAQVPELTVTKADSLIGLGVAGDTINYSIVITNTGNVTVPNVNAVDSLADADASLACAPAQPIALAPGASATCTAAHTVTQTEVNAGSVANQVAVTGDDPAGNPTVTDDSDDPDDPSDVDPDGDGEPDDPTITPLAQVPGLTVTKVDSLNGSGAAGDTIDYTIDVTNSGTVTIDNVAVSDSLADADASLDCSPTITPTTLDPGDSFSCTATHSVVQTEVDAGLVTNTATAGGTDPSGTPVTDDSDDPDNPTDSDPDGDGNPDDPTVTPLVPVTELQVTKTDSLNGTGIAGDTIDYTIGVVNTGTVTLNVTAVNDTNSDGGTLDCSPTVLPASLAPGASFTCAAVHTITQTEVDAGEVVNVATVDATDPSLVPITDESDDPDDPTNDDPDADGEPDDPTITPLAQTPGLSVTKADLVAGSGAVGDDINYTITTTNTGTVTITDISLTDSLADADASLDCSPTGIPASLTPGQQLTCTAVHTITQADLDAGQVVNAATATGLDHLGAPVSDDSDDPADPTDVDPNTDGEPDDPTVTPLAQAPELSVLKTDSVNGTGIAGDTIDYTITATNTGNVSLSAVSLTDSLADADASLTCVPVTPVTLAPGASITCTAVHTILQSEVDAGEVVNAATATGTDPNARPVTDESDDPDDPTNTDPDGDGNPDDPTITPLASVPELAVTKVDLLAGSGVAGDTITYTITTTNIGTVSLSAISLTDSLADADASLACVPPDAFDLAPGASATCTATHTVTQAEVDAGEVTNVATATGTDPSGNRVTDDSDDPDDPADVDPDGDGEPDDPTVTPLAQTPGLAVLKADALNGSGAAGDTVDYTIVIINTGTVTIDNVSVSDSLADADAALDCSPTVVPATMAPGTSFTCTTTHTVTQAEVDAGRVINAASATGTDPGGSPVTDDSDDPDDPTNVDPDGDGNPDDPTVTPIVGDAALEVTKAGIVSGTGVVGDTINYTIEVMNTGILSIDNIGLVDSLPTADATLACGVGLPATLAPNGAFTCTASHTITQTDIDAGGVTNVATASGTDPSGNPVTDESDDPNDTTDVDPDFDGEPDDPTFNPLTSRSTFEVLKTASIATTATEGDQVDYTIIVVNSGTTSLTNVDLTDNNTDLGSIDCSPTVLTTSLNPGESFTCSAVHTVTLTDLGDQEIVNTATATGDDPIGDPVTDDSDDPTEPANVDPDGDGNPDDPTVVNLIPPVATGNSYTSPTPASPDNPTVIRVIIDDFDPDGTIDPTSVSIVGGDDLDGDGLNDQLIVPGEGIWTIDRPTGQVTFTPEAGFTLDPTPITYTVQDDIGLVSNPSDVTIDYPPVASPDSSSGNDVGVTVTLDVLVNDTTGDIVEPATLRLVGGTDTDGDGLADQLIAPGQGTWVVDIATGQITFSPEPGFFGDPDPIEYSVADDDGNLTQGTVTIDYVDRAVTTIAGAVFNDTNNNRVFDAGESGFTNVEVELRCPGLDGLMGTTDAVIQLTTTAGGYEFTGVPIGETCQVIVDQATLSNFAVQTADPDSITDSSTSTTITGPISGLNFGYRNPPPALSLTGRSIAATILFALLLIILGFGFIVLPEWLEKYREPEFY